MCVVMPHTACTIPLTTKVIPERIIKFVVISIHSTIYILNIMWFYRIQILVFMWLYLYINIRFSLKDCIIHYSIIQVSGLIFD